MTLIAVELAIIISASLFNPVLATYRLEQTANDRVVRTSPRTALAVVGLLSLTTPLLLPPRGETAPVTGPGWGYR